MARIEVANRLRPQCARARSVRAHEWLDNARSRMVSYGNWTPGLRSLRVGYDVVTMQESKGFKGLVMGQLDSRSSDVGARVLVTASNVKRIANEIRSDDLGGGVARLADRGAQTLERIGSYLRESSGERLVRDAERLGRERPWTVAATGVVLGLVGSRMLKASAANRQRDELLATKPSEYGFAG